MNNNLFDQFEELLAFGYQEMKNIGININKQKQKTILFFSIMGCMQSYSEAILILIKNKKFKAAQTFMRPLLEVYINLLYILKDRKGQKNAHKFTFDQQYWNKKRVHNLNQFLKENPKIEAGQYRNTDWQKKEDEIDRNIQHNLKTRPFLSKRLPSDLRARAQIIDKETGGKNTEFLYLTVHGLFSDYLHLTSAGLGSFYKKIEEGNYIFDLSGDQKEGETIVITAFIFYCDILNKFFRYFRIRKLKELKKFRKSFIKEHSLVV